MGFLGITTGIQPTVAFNALWFSEKSSVSLRGLPATQQIQGPEGQQDSAVSMEGGNSSD